VTQEQAPKPADVTEISPATAAINRIFDSAAANTALSSLVAILRDAYEQNQWTSRQLTVLLERAAVAEEAEQ
jgi:alkaline phosphatase